MAIMPLVQNDQKPCQHIGISIDQVLIEDELETYRKMGDNKAAAVPTSGAHQHKPHKKNCRAHKTRLL